MRSDVEAREPNKASLNLRVGSAELALDIQVTSAGLLSIGAMVASILIGTSLVVWTATSPARLRAADRNR